MKGALGGWIALGLAAAVLGGCASEAEKLAEHRSEARELSEEGEHREALLHLRQALRIAPKDAEINLEIAETLKQMDRPGDASFYYAEAYRLDPELSEAGLSHAPLLYGSEPEEARAIVEEVIERDPGNHMAYYRLAELELLAGDTDAALSAALTARELAPEAAESHRIVGQVHQSRARARRGSQGGDAQLDPELLESALEAFRRAEELEPTWYHRHDIAGLYASWPGHEDEARDAYREAFAAAREAGDEDGMRSVAVAAFAWAADKRDLAFLRWSVERQLEVRPSAVSAWERLALLAEAEEEGSADAVWQRALEQRPQDPMIHGAWASHLASTKRRDEALAHLESLDPETASSPELQLLLARSYANHERLADARDVVARMREEHAGDPRTELAAASVAMAEGRRDEAVETLREIAGEANRVDAYRMLAQLELEQGRAREALAAANRALDMETGQGRRMLYELRHSSQTRLRLWQDFLRSLRQMREEGLAPSLREQLQFAQAQYALGRNERGLAVLESLIEREEPSLRAVLLFAQYENKRQPERTTRLLEEAVEQHGPNPGVVASLAQLALQRGSPQEALEQIARAGEPEELEARLRLMRARALAELERWPEAEVDARAVFEAGATDASTQLLVRILNAQDRQDEAVAALEEARSDRRLSGRSLWLLGRMHMDRENLDEARVVLEEAVGAAPNLYIAHNDLAYVLAETGEDLERALNLASQARSALPEAPAVADTQAWVYYRRGMYGPALEQFRAALDLLDQTDSGNEGLRAEIHYRLGLTLREMGRTKEALEAVDRALEIRPDHPEARDMRSELAATSSAEAEG